MSKDQLPPGAAVAINLRDLDGDPVCVPARTVRAATPNPFLQPVTISVGAVQRPPVIAPRRQLTPWEERSGPAVSTEAAAAHDGVANWIEDVQLTPLAGLLEWARTLPDEQLAWTADPLIPQLWTYATSLVVRHHLDRSSSSVEIVEDWRVFDLIDLGVFDYGLVGVGPSVLSAMKLGLELAGVLDLPAPGLDLPGHTTPAQRSFAPLAAIISRWTVRDLTHPGPAPQPPRSTLGAPGVASAAEMAAASRQMPRIVASQHAAVEAADGLDLEAERQQVAAMRRWGPGRTMPDRLVPGDVSWIRTHHMDGGGHPPPFVNAVPYFVPSGATPMLEAEPPPRDLAEQLLMPHDQMLVAWADPLELRFDDPMAWATWPLHEPAAWIEGARGGLRLTRSFYLVGLQLIADPETHRPAEVMLIAVTEADTLSWGPQGQTTEGADLGLRAAAATDWQASDVAGLVDNVLALVDYSMWDEPPPVELPPAGKARRKALRSSKVRKELLGGAGVDRMRVMALGRTAAKQAATSSSSSGTPKRPHLRRGYWRRQRVGPREAWWHEVRYIGPTVVNNDLLAEGERPRGRTIWMVPKRHART